MLGVTRRQRARASTEPVKDAAIAGMAFVCALADDGLPRKRRLARGTRRARSVVGGATFYCTVRWRGCAWCRREADDFLLRSVRAALVLIGNVAISRDAFVHGFAARTGGE